jgi:iron complex outermembrane receptor protein
MQGIFCRLQLGASSLALMAAVSCFSTGALAQNEPASGQQVENVVVSSTRITTAGFNAPTPTTVVGQDFLEGQAQPNIFDSIIQLPSLMGSQSMSITTNGTSGGSGGLSAFSLLGLGAIRTLTLIDGERVVPANVTGIADVSEFPQLLVQRVDVVTGGASASWGSDAVGGVVNFVTDKNFTGIKANIEGGISNYADNATGTLELAAGTGFAGGRGHIEMSVEYTHSDGVEPNLATLGCCTNALPNGRTWFTEPTILSHGVTGTPTGQPEEILATGAQDFQVARFGIITAGPLQGTAFQASGQPYQFVYGSGGVPQKNASGTVVSPTGLCISPFCVGGEQDGDVGAGVTLAEPYTRGNIYTRLSYNLTPNTTVWTTIDWAEMDTSNIPNPTGWFTASLSIQCGNAAGGANAYLPASVNQGCLSNNITSFQYGNDFGNLGPEVVHNLRDQRRYVVGADGDFDLFSSNWTWNSYYEHGENDTRITGNNIDLNPNLKAAIDAVTNSQGNIVCRSTVAQAEGCIPFNPFGDTIPTQGQLQWLYGGSHYPGPMQLTHQKQDAASIGVNGTPLSDWAGKISLASGLEYRQEGYNVAGDPVGNGGTTDPLLNPQGNNWYAGNFHSGQGSYHVWEGFMEFGVPLLNDTTWGKADLDLAGRATGYSTSGYVQTWKVGVVWDTPLDGLRLRALQSRDVRAPNLSELFSAGQVANVTTTDPFTNGSQQVQQVNEGNVNLKPERSTNTQLGVVYQPSWFPGFSSSIDYYRVYIAGQISTGLSPVSLCFEGIKSFCPFIITNPPGGDPTLPNAVWSQIVIQAYNVASTVTDGFNIESSYQFDLEDLLDLPGNFTIRGLGTHVSKFITSPGVPGTISTDEAGANEGFGNPTITIPHWKILGIQTYTATDWSFTVTENWISPGKINPAAIQCTTGCPLPTTNNPTINYNSVPGIFYVAIGGTYNINPNWQAYFKIDNLANTPPPPDWGGALNLFEDGANTSLYDDIGRMFHVGVRLNM